MSKDEPGENTNAYAQGVVFRVEATGLEEVHLCVGGPDIGRLKEAILAAFQQTLKKHLPRKEFGGVIQIVILSEVTPETPGLRRAMAEMEAQLKSLVMAGRLKTVMGRPVHVGLEYTGRDEEA